jgi:anti-sigma regulatory factor (Ser/Thr protein kinase)/anti-anti-sigma regulatory factor
VTKQVLQELTRITGHSDDITILAAHRRKAVQPFTRSAPALPGFISQSRIDLDTWLHELDADPVQAMGISHAVVEMTTNVVEHAYSDATEPGRMTVTAALEATGILEVSVRDTGTWQQPTRDHRADGNDRGQGLALAGAMVDELTIDHDASGTTTRCRTHLGRPPALDTSAGRPHAAPDPASTSTLSPDFTTDLTSDFSEFLDGDKLVVTGPIDFTTAPYLERALRNHMHHAARSLTVDLSQVTHLASAGVQVLAKAIHRTTHASPSKSKGAELTLYAPAGTPAQHVLALTQLPNTTGTGPDDKNAGRGHTGR